MGGKGSGRPRMSYKKTLIEICRLQDEIHEELEAANAAIGVLDQRLRYYIKTVNKRFYTRYKTRLIECLKLQD
jgi:hypothetical protein